MPDKKNKAKFPLTPFSRKVYDLCRRVPRGRVITYGDLARKIGHPGASRAVGNVLHKNPFAPVVPCHRVICRDGRLGGYRQGQSKKATLLRAEGVIIIKGKIDRSRFAINR